LKETGKMYKNTLRKPAIIILTLSILLFSFALMTNKVLATGGSITLTNSYPNNQETYTSIDHFITQTTAVNTNTTVSISIDKQPPITMIYQGIRNEIVPGDSENRSWYTWQATTSPLTTPGKHSYQFFSHYYVWQNADQYWAEYNSYSTIRSFTIDDPKSAVSQLPQPKTINIFFLSLFAAVLAAALIFLAVTIQPNKFLNKCINKLVRKAQID
jgi:hypothetical protein